MALHWFLIAWYAFSHTIYVVTTPGAPDHPVRIVYGGSGPECLSIARQIGGAVDSLGGLGQVWPF